MSWHCSFSDTSSIQSKTKKSDTEVKVQDLEKRLRSHVDARLYVWIKILEILLWLQFNYPRDPVIIAS